MMKGALYDQLRHRLSVYGCQYHRGYRGANTVFLEGKMKIKASNKSSGLIFEDGKEIHFWLPKMDKSDSPPPNSAWIVLCLVKLLGKYDQRLNDLIYEKRDEIIKETTKLTLVKGGGVNEHTAQA